MCARNKNTLQKGSGRKRIALFGGTFDPPHIGHLIIAETAWNALELEKLYFVPAYIPPHKRRQKCTTPLQRLEMLKLAVRDNPHFDILDTEIKRKGISYTVETLEEIQREYPEAELFLILGSDNLKQFYTWREPERILSMAKLVVYERPMYPLQKNENKVLILKGALLDISSTFIRKQVSLGVSIRYLVPREVELFIREHRLYRLKR